MAKVYIYLENGFYTEAEGFGAEGTSVGEIVFNTSMTGYQEIITDPSYAGQFITFTAPEIGIVGVNEADKESRGVYCKGVIVRDYQETPSNFRSEDSLDDFLKFKGILGITKIDTREITKILRDEGAMMMIASTEISDKEALKAELAKSPRIEEINYIEEVGTKEEYKHTQSIWNHSKM
ncbi:MAG: carbamoyl phosphate synthase small subunit, partial [Campylobacterales bacterium]|nr:carbamoyl phosphate synthase small subunit [Campylobacterales bacterium]